MASFPEQLSPDIVQARLAAIVTSSDDAIVSKDLNGTIQSWNASAERIFGFTAAEAIGKSITIIIPPERLSEEDHILAQVRSGNRVEHFQTIRMRKDGQRVAVSVTISPVYDASGKVVGASKVARDITLHVELEGMFEAIVANSDDAIVSKDLFGIVRSWNRSAERIFGYMAAEMIGEPILKIIPADRQHEEPGILERLRRGERIDHFETVRQRKDGALIDVSVTVSPIKDPTGRVIGASKIARDITESKRINREREQLLQSEHAARKEAERIGRVKDEFLATLSHELRTPLNAILGWAQLLRVASHKPSEVAQGLETIERNARAQTHLIEELLDMSRIISGKVRIDVQRVDLWQVIVGAIEAVTPGAEAKGLRIERLLDTMAGPIMGDPTRLQQVVWNLLSNAIKFTPKGGKVQVILQRVASHIEIVVTDTGQGIKSEFLPHLFERFTQADASTTRRHGGLGLGLAIVRHLVELHGGSVHARSAGEGKGATFTVMLPMSAVAHHGGDDESKTSTGFYDERTPPPAMVDLSGVKVLIVDDERDARELVKRVLEAAEATVFTASSAQEGFEALKREQPTVLLSDIGMPGEDGYALITKVRALPAEQGGNVSAGALTAFARSEDRRRALMAGFQMHIPKPIEAAELLAVVASLAGVAGRSSHRGN